VKTITTTVGWGFFFVLWRDCQDSPVMVRSFRMWPLSSYQHSDFEDQGLFCLMLYLSGDDGKMIINFWVVVFVQFSEDDNFVEKVSLNALYYCN